MKKYYTPAKMVLLALLLILMLFALLSFSEYMQLKTLAPKAAPSPPKAEITLTDTVPDDFPQITLNVNDNPSNGMIFLSNFPLEPGVNYTPYLMILNNDGSPWFYRKMNANLNLDFKQQPNGTFTWFDFDMKKFYAMDSTFAVVDSFACSENYSGDEHELRLLDNGNYLLLANDIRQINMAQIVPGGKPNAKVIGFVIQELTHDGQVIFEWNTFDHFNITDATDGIDLTGFVVDYVHCNAIEVDNDGNLLLSSRYLDEITKIDITTGDIIWRMGGKMCKNNQFRFINDSTADFFGFSHQHAIRRISNGHITLMDNGNLKSPQFSRAVEYALDEENKTATLVWQFRHSPDIYDKSMGYVQRLDNGNTLIGWGENTQAIAVTEVNPGGRVVYELSLPEKQYSYRAFKFNLLHTSVPKHPFSNSNTSIKAYPNPFSSTANIAYHLDKAGHVTILVYSQAGQQLIKLTDKYQQPGNYYLQWDGTDNRHQPQHAGSYLMVIKHGNHVLLKKLIKVK